ncbi:MAG TPA: sulfite exporter TauE/SafE family protein [Parachlamydiaceae bacterium]|nr:sulfite exporter TauE/SafE family protein [Parachlamydiaceae bacterium]
MTLLLSMLPLYLFGNLHCLGMCGPLVMMIGHHRYRYFYFLGRTLSFSLAGMIAGAIGAVSDSFFRHYHLGEATTFLFGFILLILGVFTLLGWSYPGHQWLARRLAGVNQTLSMLMLRDKAWPAFLFGFFTLALPCGQTLIVFSACALSGDMYVGLLNGFAFAVLTSPSLFFAMKAHAILRQARQYYRAVVGISALIVGLFAILRGMAEAGFISHWILNPASSPYYHIVIF